MRWLHRYNQVLSVASLILIAAGGLVTSTGSGLAVPDWPNTYGYFMLSFPLSNMKGGILYEHGHRLIASIVGLLTVGLAIGLSRLDGRRWVRRLGWFALAAVIAQGILGGITAPVLSARADFDLPRRFSTALLCAGREPGGVHIGGVEKSIRSRRLCGTSPR